MSEDRKCPTGSGCRDCRYGPLENLEGFCDGCVVWGPAGIVKELINWHPAPRPEANRDGKEDKA